MKPCLWDPRDGPFAESALDFDSHASPVQFGKPATDTTRHGSRI